MNDTDLYSLLADTILVIHFAFVVFVVFGFMLILVGLLARWSWVHNRKFRITDLAAIGNERSRGRMSALRVQNQVCS